MWTNGSDRRLIVSNGGKQKLFAVLVACILCNLCVLKLLSSGLPPPHSQHLVLGQIEILFASRFYFASPLLRVFLVSFFIISGRQFCGFALSRACLRSLSRLECILKIAEIYEMRSRKSISWVDPIGWLRNDVLAMVCAIRVQKVASEECLGFNWKCLIENSPLCNIGKKSTRR